MSDILYAAYGSNLHPLRLSARTPSARLVGTAQLPEWSLRFHKRSLDMSGKCSIQYGSSGVYVAVYRMRAADKQVLDRIEGVGEGYCDASVVVPGVGECATYVASASHIDDDLTPYDWYQEMVLLGCRWLGLPADYLQQIQKVTVMQDPDPRRRRDNWKTVGILRDSVARRVN